MPASTTARPTSRWCTAVASFVAAALAGSMLAGCSTAPVEPRDPTPAELQEAIARDLVEGGTIGTSVYDSMRIAVVRAISAREWAPVMSRCMEDRHVTGVEFLDNGSIAYPAMPSQTRAEAEAAVDACRLQYPSPALVGRIRTDAQWSYVYNWVRYDWAPCMRSLGFAVADPGTEADYVAVARLGRDDGLIPAALQPARGTLRAEVVAHQCPALPPGIDPLVR